MNVPKEDVQLALDVYGWYWENLSSGRKLLVPPKGSDMEYWTFVYDIDGVPKNLPKYSEKNIDR